jgi:hypothetical protein
MGSVKKALVAGAPGSRYAQRWCGTGRKGAGTISLCTIDGGERVQ